MLYRQMICTVGVIGLALTFVSSARAEKYPRMIAALGEMKEAHREMKDAGTDFGGHKEKALEATDRAIVQMDKALRAVGIEPVYVAPARDAYKEYRNYPHIRHALAELRTALREMRDAATDFGGHKEKAIEATEASDHASWKKKLRRPVDRSVVRARSVSEGQRCPSLTLRALKPGCEGCLVLYLEASVSRLLQEESADVENVLTEIGARARPGRRPGEVH